MNHETIYTTRHHRGYDCGHNHTEVASAMRCLKRHRNFKEFKCTECGEVRFGFRWVKCRKCKHPDCFESVPYNSDYYRINASDDGGVSWRHLSAAEQHELAQAYHGKTYK